MARPLISLAALNIGVRYGPGRESNPQPSGYESTTIPLGHPEPLDGERGLDGPSFGAI